MNLDLSKTYDSIASIHNIAVSRMAFNPGTVESMPQMYLRRFEPAQEGAEFIADNVKANTDIVAFAIVMEELTDMVSDGDELGAKELYESEDPYSVAIEIMRELASDFFDYWDGRTNNLWGYSFANATEADWADYDDIADLLQWYDG